MGTSFLLSPGLGLGFDTFIERAPFLPVPVLDKIGLPKHAMSQCVPPCAARTYAVRPVFFTGGRGAVGSRSKQMSKGASSKRWQQLFQGHSLGLLDEVGTRGTVPRTRKSGQSAHAQAESTQGVSP